jgi:hypothetical protein
MMLALTTKKKNRFRYLHRLCERTDGRELALEDKYEIGDEIGLSREETENVVSYLIGEGLASHRDIGQAIGITHAGLVEVERALSEPDVPTEHFPPMINMLQVQSMIGSQIQQGTKSSTQSQTISQNDLEAIRSLLLNLKSNLAELPLKDEEREEAYAEVQTLEAQLQSNKPKTLIIRESLRTLRSLLEGVASSTLASQLLLLFAPIAKALGF